jgi:nucleotide-binding universal stress UspA family protein
MYQKIVIATDGTKLGNKAVQHGLALAKSVNAAVTLVTVSEMWSAIQMAQESISEPEAVPHYEALAAERAKLILDAATAKAKAAGVTFDARHVSDRHPAEGIVGVAEETGADLIVMASHGRRGLGRLFLGSQAIEVLTVSKIPVLIVR